ncbi:unnamed protein product [Bursaphelenchus xylophilus]|uniref:(pine wood nematode) hypothetical protein n=1 Tax=Bursaphelenchus xylophilus TaxID=6326 RepID=A0A1I7RHZ2_BURXY|nr:unnamed protein product [Bursaphelenchus xylophilus]CAG9115273.1 unnamed protein product [Bursaphelenchus xylophilus]
MILRQGLLVFLLHRLVTSLECFKNTPSFDYQVQYCDSRQFPFCLKADSYDGRVYRNCASLEQCPQGIGCAPITYDEDGTTDYVCCCANDICNSSWTSPLSFYTLFLSISIYFYYIYNQ